LLALVQYSEYVFLYSKIDDNNDRKLDYREFLKARSVLRKWTGEVPDMKKAF